MPAGGSVDVVELLDRPAFDAWMDDPARSRATVVDLDLRDVDLAATDLRSSTFLGCRLQEQSAAHALATGCRIVPQPADVPFTAYRSAVYSIGELYAGFDPAVPGSRGGTPDAAAYRWFVEGDTRRPRTLGVEDLLAARSHDSTVEAALTRLLAAHARPVIGVMGGHDDLRGSPAYRQVVEAARAITARGGLIVTGGGPGLMEAANLGAFLHAFPDVDAGGVVDRLATATDFASHEWLATAAAVRADLLGSWDAPAPSAGDSIGVPTWLYGHEPPNLFASQIAKLFFNSLREDGLVTIADGGIVFAPGHAGTVQEVFQDANQNYYRGALRPTPMVLLGRDYWDARPFGAPPGAQPLWPLLRRLGEERGFTSALLLTDDVAEVVDRLTPPPEGAATLAWRRAFDQPVPTTPAR